MSQQAFYQTERVLAPIANQRGPVMQHYIITVDTHDPDGKLYPNPKKRAREAFNLLPGRAVDDWMALAGLMKKTFQKRNCNKLCYVTMARFISSKMTEFL